MKSKTRKAAGKASLRPLVRACESCAAWVELFDEEAPGLGTCRRFPPHFQGHCGAGEHWPETELDDWCMEYIPNAAGHGQPTGREVVP